MRDIRRARANNRALYVMLEDDKTMDMVEGLHRDHPELAKEWHRKVLENDSVILELTKELCK